jgi:hypothetical protein
MYWVFRLYRIKMKAAKGRPWRAGHKQNSLHFPSILGEFLNSSQRRNPAGGRGSGGAALKLWSTPADTDSDSMLGHSTDSDSI